MLSITLRKANQKASLKINDLTNLKSQEFSLFRGNKAGIKYAPSLNFDLSLILNDDTIVHENLMLNLIKAYKLMVVLSHKIYFIKKELKMSILQ